MVVTSDANRGKGKSKEPRSGSPPAGPASKRQRVPRNPIDPTANALINALIQATPNSGFGKFCALLRDCSAKARETGQLARECQRLTCAWNASQEMLQSAVAACREAMDKIEEEPSKETVRLLLQSVKGNSDQEDH
ncbi:hypothetical protein N7488_005759 [Penicillium malachiteum]|nr:hypothetical protein N7488_005759 [Penicillium malachiteum]